MRIVEKRRCRPAGGRLVESIDFPPDLDDSDSAKARQSADVADARPQRNTPVRAVGGLDNGARDRDAGQCAEGHDCVARRVVPEYDQLQPLDHVQDLWKVWGGTTHRPYSSVSQSMPTHTGVKLMLLPLANPKSTQYVTKSPRIVVVLVSLSSDNTVAGSQRPREVVMQSATCSTMVL